jgi:hypothetical protein
MTKHIDLDDCAAASDAAVAELAALRAQIKTLRTAAISAVAELNASKKWAYQGHGLHAPLARQFYRQAIWLLEAALEDGK